MKLSNFVDGLSTLRPYYNDPDGYHIGAEHDQFWAFQTDKPLPPEVVQQMIELGWFQEYERDDDDKDDGEDFALKDYRADESWTAYT